MFVQVWDGLCLRIKFERYRERDIYFVRENILVFRAMYLIIMV